MSTSALATTLNHTYKFYQATIGKKVIMAVTGCILFLFVLGHMIGNLQIYLGSEQLNYYAEHLHKLAPLLWAVRLIMLAVVATHIYTAIQLWWLNRSARPAGYLKQGWVHASFASRTMIYSGLIIGAFIVYHILHLTTGQAHPGGLQYLPDGNIDVYTNVVNGFRQIPASAVYIVAMIALWFHLSHGVWSMFQSVGINHPRLTPKLEKCGLFMATLIAAGDISIPVAVMIWFIR